MKFAQPITKKKDSAFGNDEAVAISVAAELGFAITSIGVVKTGATVRGEPSRALASTLT